MAANDMYDVGPVSMGGQIGDAGAAAYFGMQQELMRRQQQVELQKAQQRQTALDEQNRQKVQEELATSKLLRESVAAENAAKTQGLQQAQFTSMNEPGTPLNPADKATALRLFGPSAVTSTAETPAMTAGVPTAFAQAPDIATVASGEVTQTLAKPASELFTGTVAQRERAQHQKLMQAIANGEHDTGNEGVDAWMKARALDALAGGKEGSIPAGIVTPKAPAAEKDAAKYLDIGTRAKLGKTVTPEERAWSDTYESQHPTEAQKQKDAIQKLSFTVNAAGSRQEASFSNKAVESDYADLRGKYDKNIEPTLLTAQKLVDTLNSPGGVNDVVAVPEFLSSMAGGQGHGLRMTQAELNMIQNARPGTESVWIKLKNLAGNYTALTPAQRQQMMELTKSVATRQIKTGEHYAAAMDAISKAKSGVESHKILTDLMRLDLSTAAGAVGAEGGNGTKRLVYNPATGKVE